MFDELFLLEETTRERGFNDGENAGELKGIAEGRRYGCVSRTSGIPGVFCPCFLHQTKYVNNCIMSYRLAEGKAFGFEIGFMNGCCEMWLSLRKIFPERFGTR